MTGLPPLRALHYFHQAALNSSFSLAAEHLHVTHSAISHQIRQLESWMGKPLFVRTQGRVKLTSHGERLLLSCQKAFSELHSTCESIRTGMRYHLKVSCSPSFLSQWLIPRIATFYQRHPDIEIQFQALANINQLRSEHTDILVLSQEQPPDGDIDATLVSEDYTGPLCAPLFAQRFRSDRDLAELPLLHADTHLQAWSEWANRAGARGNFRAGKHFENLTLAIQAARNGLGVIIAPRLLVRQELEDGTLIAPIGFVRVDRATWMMTKEGRRHDAEISLFRNWLREAAQA
ncbi:LysR substrate-binding domain-containing protein [Pantoea sp. LMR881]|uniref:LysR substrate-binding domain-containing protein n=1 Tax=Pantoea sp. LMR881 TaxID=3014336 RepID=UPI0022AF0BC7|nr:LysR substrate-binding domain-containing protein [Pantoea sp. LMR881]MCZ4059060.1 LysR substrate-binding domain-containing protein [Pantoea sp. LMR881]